MSDRGPPERDDRTIIRPNPGGRRPGPPSTPQAPSWPQAPTPPEWGKAAAPPAPPGTRNESAWPPSDWTQSPPPPPQGLPRAAPPPASPPRAQAVGPDEDWIASAAPAPVATGPSRRALARIDELFAPNSNPLMRAASPLLLMLGRLRASLLTARFAPLMEQVAQAIQNFDVEIRKAGVPEDQATMAKYIVCATADDIVQNIPADDRHEWSRHSMLASFFGERIGGVRFFELVDRAKVDPVVNYSLLELEHACLALGFQGRYRSEGGGFATLQQVQRNIYETLRRVRPKVARDLSPRWKGQALAARKTGVQVPVWAVGSVALLLCFVLFAILRYLLSGGAEAASAATLALNPATPITLARKTFVPPPPPPVPTVTQLTQLQRIRAALAPEIKAGTISVPDPTGPNWIVINVGSLLLFKPGQAAVISQFMPLADRIRTMLEQEIGTIGVIGHTDNTALGPTDAFKSNYDLSVARAKNVVAILKDGFPIPSRFKLEGKGADMPIADNKTEAGRRQNRRVEILVQRTD
ncbi:type IVB secretion system protein IcmH/DotU [Lichenifustis flavocetrariae]|uniref:Type IVB secretion system protein IcmH/DotU n=1 Tax=Lichenifustis flavocetrariae TaxID=2949735 RepID=A0AA42CKX0_9HYPH|nr:type IVB secretion system protein IcmH/DotU [Lichenifustis flavocetrariae]MCW6506725.1 type IVB secretion system protein IcmH/DotU [Lichenifustis flavocetrariae]